MASAFGEAAPDAAAIGAAYALASPDDPVVVDPERLPNGLAPAEEPDGSDWLDRSDPAEVRAALERASRLDFAEGRVRDLQGWLLPLTLLQVCAMVSEA